MYPHVLLLKVQNKKLSCGGLDGMSLGKKIILAYKKLKLNVNFSSQIDHRTGKPKGFAV
jgi:hypothetical protein